MTLHLALYELTQRPLPGQFSLQRSFPSGRTGLSPAIVMKSLLRFIIPFSPSPNHELWGECALYPVSELMVVKKKD